MKRDWIKVEYKNHVYTFEKCDKQERRAGPNLFAALVGLEAWYCEEINRGMYVEVEYSIEAKREELLNLLKIDFIFK